MSVKKPGFGPIVCPLLCSDGPQDHLCNFDDSRHGRPSVVGELFGYLLMGKAILMKDNYRFLLPQGEMGHKKRMKKKAQKYNGKG